MDEVAVPAPTLGAATGEVHLSKEDLLLSHPLVLCVHLSTLVAS